MVTTEEEGSEFEPQFCLFLFEFACSSLGRCFVPQTCRLTGDSKLSVGVNLSMTGCLCLYVNFVIDWHPVLGVNVHTQTKEGNYCKYSKVYSGAEYLMSMY